MRAREIRGSIRARLSSMEEEVETSIGKWLRRRALPCPRPNHDCTKLELSRFGSNLSKESSSSHNKGHLPRCDFFVQTKIPFSRISKMVKYMGFYNYEFFDSRGRKEWLVVGWKCGVDIKVIFKSKNMVNYLVFSYPINEPWLLSLVYGHPKSVKRSCYGKQ